MKGLIIVLLAAVVACSAFYEDNKDVVKLTDSNFAQEVIGSDHVWVVEFYAPWCGHCQHFAPEFARAAKNLHGIVHVGAVNCDEDKQVCGAFGIQGFPTVKLFPWSTVPVKDGQPGQVMKQPVDYNGARSAAALVNAAIDMIPNFVHNINNAASEEKFFGNSLTKVLLFTDKSSTPTLFKALALEYRNRLAFGYIKNSNKELVEKFGVEKYPTVLVQKKGEDTTTAFEDKISFDALNSFLKKFAPPLRKVYEAGPSKEGEEEEGEGMSAKPIDPTEFELKRITSADDWEANCVERSGLCAVAVLDPYNYPEDLEKQEALLTELAAQYAGKLHMMWFAAREQPSFCEALGLSNFPSLMLINPARRENQKTRYSSYRGAFDEEDITSYLDRFLTGGRGAVVLEKEFEFRSVNPEDYLAPKDELLDDDDVDVKVAKEEL